jgi:predicted DNA-binding protein (MmcQ/YjbR family)
MAPTNKGTPKMQFSKFNFFIIPYQDYSISEKWNMRTFVQIYLINCMNIEEFREYCLLKPATTESFPFDENTLVFKVAGKMFALTDLADTFSINLKCDPEKCLELREHYECVKPGYHMNKKHWNTIMVDSSVSDMLLMQWIDASYNLVVLSLTKSQRAFLD